MKQSAIGSVSTITDKMQAGSMQRSEKIQKIRSLDCLARSNTAVCKVLYVPVGATLRVAYDILASPNYSRGVRCRLVLGLPPAALHLKLDHFSC